MMVVSRVGDRTNARGDYGVAMGADATVGKNDPSESESQNGIAIGHGATVSVNLLRQHQALQIRVVVLPSVMMRQLRISIQLLSVQALSVKVRKL
ncbi:MAG: hypothetical protein ACLR5T_06305 [Veillonella sp.]